MVCQNASMSTLPDTSYALVLRTDFSDDAAWDAVCRASTAPSPDGFSANVTFVSDPAFADLTAEQITALPRVAYRRFVFLVDHVTITHSEMPVLVVDLLHEPGRWFRVVPTEMWSVENNLSIANMDFFEFADHADTDGVFRGFPKYLP